MWLISNFTFLLFYYVRLMFYLKLRFLNYQNLLLFKNLKIFVYRLLKTKHTLVDILLNGKHLFLRKAKHVFYFISDKFVSISL